MDSPGRNPWARKLRKVIDLSEDDEQLVDRLVSQPRHYDPGEDIVHQGEIPREVHVVLNGCAVRYKILPSGARQIMALLLPGDLCDLHTFLLREMDHNIGAIVASSVAKIRREEILDILDSRPKLTKALWWNTLQDEAILREWIVGMGRRSAVGRIAHFFYEIYLRLEAVGFAADSMCNFPLTQSELADAMGVSSVHVNRTVQELRRERLIEWEGRQLTILDLRRLKDFTDFDPDYLHLDGGSPGQNREETIRVPKPPRE